MVWFDAHADINTPAPLRRERCACCRSSSHSLPAVLKNAIDWASRPVKTTVLRNKPAAVIGASTGMFGAVWAQAELRKVLGTAGARVLDAELPIALADEAFTEAGLLADPDTHRELEAIVADLVGAGERRRAAAA